MPSRMFAEVDPERPPDPVELGRYLSNKFVNMSQGLGIFPSGSQFGPLTELYHRERDQLVAEASAQRASAPQQQEEPDENEPEAKRVRQDAAMRTEDMRILAMLGRCFPLSVLDKYAMSIALYQGRH